MAVQRRVLERAAPQQVARLDIRSVRKEQPEGLLGEAWRRTVQSIDVAAGTLENRIEFEDGLLRVCSTFAPDENDGRRFNFAFESCDVRWRSVTLPLPPVGKGWGEVVYLDDDFRIQQDVRGDLLVATRLE